ncbi:MAG: energy transducer TonB [Chitinophagales bacterium]
MEPNKILSANILDLIFEDRNKEYGAYELRVTYPERVKKSMIVVFVIAAIAITGAALANSFKPKAEGRIISKEVTIQDIEIEKKEVKPPPELPKPNLPETRTVQFTTPVIVDEDNLDPPPTQDEIEKARIDVKDNDGLDDAQIAETKNVDDGKGIIDEKPTEKEPEIWTTVQVPASYNGDWIKFLTRNLNANVPVENEAPVGRYNVIIQFVVDKEGNVSDITALTNYGFGMEQEAIRVLKKAKGWKAGIQEGRAVSSYHKQPITFIVEEE